jgi:hypothetical protein
MGMAASVVLVLDIVVCAADKVRVLLMADAERAIGIAVDRLRKRLVKLDVGDIKRLRWEALA